MQLEQEVSNELAPWEIDKIVITYIMQGVVEQPTRVSSKVHDPLTSKSFSVIKRGMYMHITKCSCHFTVFTTILNVN